MGKYSVRDKFLKKVRRVKQSACYNANDLRMALARNCQNVSTVIAEILIAIKVQKKRIAATVINWLQHAAKNYKEAEEVLKLVTS